MQTQINNFSDDFRILQDFNSVRRFLNITRVSYMFNYCDQFGLGLDTAINILNVSWFVSLTALNVIGDFSFFLHLNIDSSFIQFIFCFGYSIILYQDAGLRLIGKYDFPYFDIALCTLLTYMWVYIFKDKFSDLCYYFNNVVKINCIKLFIMIL